ncbi:AraC family transcriptional regulator [Aliivibrio logei]|uniref:AraC family transcriptional regulator n=1 Tax=Aliivibrio logei TaxID=688 RepID=UPI0003C79ED4|nr:helix-turn-helix domain-containing protein [Aliivibrio logei]
MSFIKILFTSVCLLFSASSFSLSENFIFYPMPIHADGQYITAQQLFLREDGALWMYDVYGQLHLFDGKNIFTLGKKSQTELPRKITLFDGRFWYIKDNVIKSWSHKEGFRDEQPLPASKKVNMLNSANGMLWGNDDEYFFVYNPLTESFSSSMINESNTSVILDQITITGAINVNGRWLVSTSEGIFEFDTTTESFAPLYLGQYIDTIFYSKVTNQIILGTHDSIWMMELTKNNLLIKQKLPINASFISFAETDGLFWFGTDDGLYQWNIKNKKYHKFNSVLRDDYSLEGNKIYGLLADKNNGLWIATDNGVSYYSDSSRLFTRIRYKEANGSLDVNEINSVLQTPDELAWLGSSTGLFLVDSNNIKKSLRKIIAKPINDLSYDSDSIWAATSFGVERIDRYNQKRTTPDALKSLSTQNIEHIFIDSTQTLWFSSKKGLYKYNVAENKLVPLGFYWAIQQKYSTQITHIYENKDGRVSIGTNVGLYQYSNGALTFDYAYSHTGSILDMADTEYGNSWIVSNYGLQLTLLNGVRKDIKLPAEYITPHCVLPSSKGVWLSSSKGLSLYTHQGRLMKHFGSQRGLINNELLPNLCSISPAGKMLFASKDGVIFVNEQDLIEYQITKPKVVFGKVKVGDRIVSYGEDNKLTKQVPYGSSISFLFGILPEFQNKYLSFQLIGSNDESWLDFEGNLLIFDSLNPGKYTLRIRPKNDGQRSSNVTEFIFYIEVPWFFAPWFVFLLFVSLVSIVITIYYWRSKEIKRSNENLRKSVGVKTKQLSNQGKVLTSSNRQLQKLLTVRQHVIAEMAEQAQQPIKDIQVNLYKKGSLTNLSLANQCEYSLQLLQQLTQLESFADLQKNRRMNQVLQPLLTAAIKSWKDEFHSKGVELILCDDSKGCSIFVEPLFIDTIFNNMLFNLLKRSDFGQQVEIVLFHDNGEIHVQFLSSGEVINDNELDELKRIDLSQHLQIMSQVALGLSSVKLLTIQNGGHFVLVKNEAGNGEIKLSWPVAVDALVERPEKFNYKIDNDKDDNQQQWLIDVYRLVEQSYGDPTFGTSAAAKLLYTSERNLQRKFKQITQRSFMEYVTEIRLEKACEMLISGNKVANAAFESGFNDPSYFSKRFKRHYGLSPTQFVSENEIL